MSSERWSTTRGGSLGGLLALAMGGTALADALVVPTQYATIQSAVDAAADGDGDGLVGAPDLAQVLSSWGACAGCAADLTFDGTVDFDDLLALFAAWGACP